MRPEWAALRAAGQVELAAYREAFADPRASQRVVLDDILADVGGSAFGAAHGLATGMSIAAFQDQVPIQDSETLAPWIARIIAGEAAVLTRSPVVAFELTGGSSGGRKPVPYTAPLLAAFQRTIMAWFGDFLTHCPAIGEGRAYFAISPALTPAADLGGIPVGLGSDLAYFGEHAAHLGSVMLYDPALEATDYEAWADATCAMLRGADDLSLISVWSPTFLTALLDRMGEFPDWPGLAMISAWGAASSEAGAADLKTRLAGVVFQPKGLLATEGVFTFPLWDHADPLPAIRSTFLEFRDEAGAVHLVDDLTVGTIYDLIVTTPGGLLRYAIGDRVTCTGHVQNAPMLKFVGRGSGTDLVGEKLTEDFVLACLQKTGLNGVLIAQDNPANYLFLTEKGFEGAAKALDAALSENPQYAYARRIRQLPLPRVETRVNLMADVVQHRLRQGHRLSDVKVPVLLSSEKARAIWPNLR